MPLGKLVGKIARKSSLDGIEDKMIRKSKEELEEIRSKYSGDSVRGMAARNELSRRRELKEERAYKPGEGEVKLTAKEEAALDRMMNRQIRGESAENPEYMSRSGKSKPLSEREKKDLQDDLEFKKGGMVKKKMMGGGYATKTAKMAKGGMANCGASMKPNGGSRNK